MRTSTALGVVAFAALCVLAVAALVWHGSDPTQLVGFIMAVIPVTVGVIAISSKVDKVQETADNVHRQVNGRLDAKFQALQDRLNELAVPDQRGKHSADSADNDLTPMG